MFSTGTNTVQKKTKIRRGVSGMAKTKTMTIQKRVENALLNGEALTSKMLTKIDLVLVTLGAVIQALRFKGLPCPKTLTKELVLKYTEQVKHPEW